jgi:hypothetical protein
MLIWKALAVYFARPLADKRTVLADGSIMIDLTQGV